MRGSLLLIAALVFVSGCSTVGEAGDGGIDAIDVTGPLDELALDFISDSIELGADQGKDLVVIQLNSKAVLDEEGFDRLAGLVELPPVPVAVWVGPAPAFAYGAAAELPYLASNAAMAPGSEEGRRSPRILGVDQERSDERVPAEETGLHLQPAFRQYLQDLDGATFTTTEGEVVVETLKPADGGGVTTKDVTFRKPGVGTRYLRLGVTPEAAFFFVTIGLTIAIFEFYALGPGVAAGVAAFALVPGVWGLVALPTSWWAVVLLAFAFLLLVSAHQKGGLFGLTILGAALLQISGMTLIDGGGQIDARWWLVALSVLTVLFFFLLAMPTVQRARLSSETVGRRALVGMEGHALSEFDPDGLAEVGGARWRATAHREAGIQEGDPLKVTGVDGLYLEVDSIEEERET